MLKVIRKKESFAIEVNVEIQVLDVRTGIVEKTLHAHNLVTLAGRNLVRDFLNGLNPAYLTHFAIGTGTTAPTANDTALEAEVFRDQITKRTPGDGTLGIQYYLSSSAANGYTLSEAGLLNAASGGVLFARVTHTPIQKTSSKAITYSWTININAQ